MVQHRQIVNGLDCTSQIEGYAQKFHAALTFTQPAAARTAPPQAA